MWPIYANLHLTDNPWEMDLIDVSLRKKTLFSSHIITVDSRKLKPSREIKNSLSYREFEQEVRKWKASIVHFPYRVARDIRWNLYYLDSLGLE